MTAARPNAPGVIFLLGPTASGKSALALKLAERLPVELVSVDSAMVYRGLDIGTSKPDAATRARVPHALIDIRDPATPYSAAEFRRDALAAIARIRAAGRHALLVGGTSLYFRALEYGLSDLPAADPSTRAGLRREAAARGWPVLHARLQALDAASAARIHPRDSARIERALEIHALTGRPASALRAGSARAADLPRPLCKILVAPRERAVLYARIESRFRAMVAAGLLQEVENLYARRDLHSELPAMRAVGYRQLWRVVAGEWSLEAGVERAITATRQLAKRQWTWLRQQSVAQQIASDAILAEQSAENTIVQVLGGDG